MALRIPRNQVDNPSQGGSNLFPEGTFRGVIRRHNDEGWRETPFDEVPEGLTNIQGVTGDLRQINLMLDDNSLVDGEHEPGKRKFFHTITYADGDVTINDLTDEQNGEGWLIRNGAALYVNLADVLEATTEDENGVSPAENFGELLAEGAFDGTPVIFEVTHRTNKKGNTREEISSFARAEG